MKRYINVNDYVYMPKFGEGSLGNKFGYRIDKTDGKVGFEDSTHTYFSLEDGSTYISVTQLIEQYTQPFDSDFWSSYKAIESLIEPDLFSIVKKTLLSTKKFDMKLLKKLEVNEKEFLLKKQEILDSYQANKEESCEHGTKVHLEQELKAYKDGGKFIKKFGTSTDEFICTPGDYDININHGMYPEILISWQFDNGLKVSGQVDLLILDNNEAIIVDFKTNREIKKKSYFNNATKKSVKMKYPLNDYDDTNFWHYTCQLSLYMYLLQQKYPDLKCKKLMLLHIDRDGKETEYEVKYIKDDIEKLINNFAKQQKVKKELAKDVPIKY